MAIAQTLQIWHTYPRRENICEYVHTFINVCIRTYIFMYVYIYILVYKYRYIRVSMAIAQTLRIRHSYPVCNGYGQ